PLAVKGLLVVLLLVAVGGVYAVTRQESGSSANIDGGVIRELTPANNSKILQQEMIGIQLQPGYDASLAVNGIAIPDDQLHKVPATNEVDFTPGPNQVFTAWPAGQNCINATYWAVVTGPSQSTGHT